MTRRRDGRCGRCRATRRRLPSSRRRGRGRSGSLPRAGGWSGRWSSQVALLLVVAGLPLAARVVVGAAGFGGGGLAGDEDPVVVFGPVAAAQVAGDDVGAGHLAASAFSIFSISLTSECHPHSRQRTNMPPGSLSSPYQRQALHSGHRNSLWSSFTMPVTWPPAGRPAER